MTTNNLAPVNPVPVCCAGCGKPAGSAPSGDNLPVAWHMACLMAATVHLRPAVKAVAK